MVRTKLQDSKRPIELYQIRLLLSSGDARSRDDPIAGMDDDAVADGEAGGNGCTPTRSLEQADGPQLGAAIYHDKGHPILAFAEASQNSA